MWPSHRDWAFFYLQTKRCTLKPKASAPLCSSSLMGNEFERDNELDLDVNGTPYPAVPTPADCPSEEE